MATLITGASSGLGVEFARRFAAEGHHVVLTARRRDRLEALADELRTDYGVPVDVVALDLATVTAAQELAEYCAQNDLTIDVLVNNAGFGVSGWVSQTDPDRLADQLLVNCVTLTGLTQRLLPGMIAAGRGTIINIASTAAFQPIPHQAGYGATKAYVLSFTEALWSETRGSGVRVLAGCPGATDTEFFQHAGEAAAFGRKRTAGQLVNTTTRALRRSAPTVIDGRFNAFVSGFLPRLVPRRVVIALAARAVQP